MKKIHKNNQLQALILELNVLSNQENVPLWKRLANDLSKPTRQRRIVNLYKIEQYARDNEIVVVPGKVLGVGEVKKKLTIAAFNFSDEAYEKIKQVGEAISINELMKKNPQGKNVRVLG